MLLVGRFIRCDNSTRCATHTDGSRVRVEMDAAAKPIQAFWIGSPRIPSIGTKILFIRLCQLIMHGCCRMQGHN